MGDRCSAMPGALCAVISRDKACEGVWPLRWSQHVARVERSETRGDESPAAQPFPDFAALNPGYKSISSHALSRAMTR